MQSSRPMRQQSPFTLMVVWIKNGTANFNWPPAFDRCKRSWVGEVGVGSACNFACNVWDFVGRLRYYLNCVTLPNASHAIVSRNSRVATNDCCDFDPANRRKMKRSRREKNAGKYKLPNCTRIWHIIHDLVVSHSTSTVRSVWWRAHNRVVKCEF